MTANAKKATEIFEKLSESDQRSVLRYAESLTEKEVPPVYKVENPVYETMDVIAEKYWDNWLILADRTDDPEGGKVLYYCKNSTKELYRIASDVFRDPKANCNSGPKFIGPHRGFMGGVFC